MPKIDLVIKVAIFADYSCSNCFAFDQLEYHLLAGEGLQSHSWVGVITDLRLDDSDFELSDVPMSISRDGADDFRQTFVCKIKPPTIK